MGWRVFTRVDDVLQWAADDPGRPRTGGVTERWDIVIANLFLHHFEATQLLALLGAVGARSARFFACEPRRAWLPLAGSHLVGALGANAVTREDAVLSVYAGFCASELTALWPAPAAAWRTREYSAGLFSHCFRAERIGVA